MASLLLVPYLKNLAYARGDEVSARIATDALNYYVLENADDVKAQWFDGGMLELVMDPWKKALEAKGVVFQLRKPVASIVFDDAGKFVALATRAMVSDRELGDEAKVFTRLLGTKFLGLSWEPAKKSLKAFDGKCTHQGCRVIATNTPGLSVFDCPCHGGQFDANGQVLRAPPTQPLAPVGMKHDAQAAVWVIDEPGAAGAGGANDGLERGDYAVLALELASLKAIFPRAMSMNRSTASIPLLRTTSVIVMRMRFTTTPAAGTKRWSGPDTGVFAAEDLLDNFFALHTMQKEFAAIDDLFLECHIGDCEHFTALDDGDLLDRALEVLDAYFPKENLRGRLDRPGSRILRHVDVFPLFAPGDHLRTPTVSDPSRPNLMLAGDWVRTDDAETLSFFMERAAITGIEAANAILRAEGRPEKARPIAATRRAPLTAMLLAFPIRAVTGVVDAVRKVLDIEYP
jgi:Rieske Fe-S protein